jgi:hypothetical protein
MSATIEAWIDDVGRPLRIVTHAVMTSSAASTSITMTHSFTYGPVPAIAVPSLDDAFPVATFAEAIRLLYA